MPFFLCPSCAKCDLVPLAVCEWILDELSAKGQLDGLALDPYPGGISFLLCNDCEERSGRQVQPHEAGSTASLVADLPDACRKLNSHLAMAGGESIKIKRSIQCYTGHFAYLADLSGKDVCVLHDWLSPAAPATEFRRNADAEGADKQSERVPAKKWWQFWK